MRFGWKCGNAIQDEWVGLIKFDERKVLKFCEKMLWVEKTSESGWEVWVFILRKFSHLKNLDGMEKLANLILDPLISQKRLSVLSRLSFSHTLQRLNGANEAHMDEMRGLYTCR